MAARLIQHDDGLYFGMPDWEYFADPALGSSDHKALAVAPEAYWHGSLHNPARPQRKETASLSLGRAVHAMALEGRAAFDHRFIRRPDDVERLTEKVRAVLAPRGEAILSGDDYDRAALAGTMIRAHPDLATALTNGYPEVSVFWTVSVDDFPVRCKARIDYLKPRAIVDLKSIAIKRPLPFKVLCIRDIRSYRYGVQASTYLEARARVPEFIRDGNVNGEPEPEWLDALAEASDFAFVWIFWASEGPPLVWSTQVSPGNPLLDDSASIVEAARRNYADFIRRHGTDAAWIDFEPISELTIDDVDGAFGRHW